MELATHPLAHFYKRGMSPFGFSKWILGFLVFFRLRVIDRKTRHLKSYKLLTRLSVSLGNRSKREDFMVWHDFLSHYYMRESSTSVSFV